MVKTKYFYGAICIACCFMVGCFGGDKSGKGAAANSAMQQCLSRTPGNHSSITFYSADAKSIYQRYLANEKNGKIRQTDLWQDIELGLPVTPKALASALSEKANLPFADKIVEELLNGEVCGAIEFNDGNFSNQDPQYNQIQNLNNRDFVIVKRLTGAKGLSAELLSAVRKIAGNENEITKMGRFDVCVGQDFMLIGTPNMVDAAKANLSTPREVKLSKFLENSSKDLVINIDALAVMANLAPTTRPIFLEPFKNISLAVNPKDKEGLATFEVTAAHGLLNSKNQKIDVSVIPATSRAMIVTNGWNLSAMWSQIKAKRANNEVINNSFAELAKSLNGEISLFFDGYLGQVKADNPELSAAIVLAFGIKEGSDLSTIEYILGEFSSSLLNGQIKKQASVESPAKGMLCSDYKNFENSDVRCLAWSDKQIFFGYKEAIRRALGSSAGRVSDISDLPEMTKALGNKHTMLAVINPGKIGSDLQLLAPAGSEDLLTPFTKALDNVGLLQLVMDGNSDTMNGELLGF